MQDKTYINLMRNYYQLGISSELGPLASLLFQAILYKANELHFPETIRISSKELCSLAGDMSYHSMWQARERLSEYKYDSNTLIGIEKGDKRKNILANFKIKYEVLLRSDNNDRITIEEPQNNDRIMTDVKDNNSSVDIIQTLSGSSSNADNGIHSEIREDENRSEKQDQTPAPKTV